MKTKCITAILCSLFIVLGTCAAKRPEPVDVRSISSYTDIPGVTEEDVSAVESIKESRRSFTYGVLYGTELFVRPDGSLAGFSKELCRRLSELFGIEFEISLHTDWDELCRKYEEGSIDFFGELSPTPERMQKYPMSYPIAEHALRLFTLADSEPILDESDLLGKKVGFLAGSITADCILSAYPELTFEVVEVDDYSEAAALLLEGGIDAFVENADSDPVFEHFPEIRSKKFFSMVYTPISVSTADPSLAPIIAVLNKYLSGGGINELIELYELGEEQYARYRLNLSYTAEERAFILWWAEQANGIPLALESNNYPISFFNEEEGEFQGIAVDIIREIGRLTGLPFQTVTDNNTQWPEIMKKLEFGELLMVSQLLHTPERDGRFLWSGTPYCVAGYALLSKFDYPYQSMYQVIHNRVGVVALSAHAEIYRGWFPENDNFVVYKDFNECWDALDAGEIDMLMASNLLLMDRMNFREKSGYKVNILFSTPLESLFGYYQSETALCAIVDKAQSFIDTERITSRWTSRTFDYSRKAAAERLRVTLFFAMLLLIVLLLALMLLVKNGKLRLGLETEVNKRTYELERQAATLSAIYTAIPDIVFCMDSRCAYTSCNPSFLRLVGYPSVNHIVGKTDAEIFGTRREMIRQFSDVNSAVLRQKITAIIEEEVIYPDGTKRLLETIKTPLFTGGVLSGLLGIARDITERKAIEESAKVASKAKSAFLSRMSHEIRTPLNAIIGMSEIARRAVSDPERALFSIDQITSSSQHLLGILNDVLDMSKIESGKLNLSHEPFAVRTAFQEVYSIVRQRCLEKDIKFICDLDEVEDLTLVGDKLRINQVLINLLGNAVKFTGHGGEIRLVIRLLKQTTRSAHVRFDISDNGIGIPEDKQARLFDPFEQADNTIAAQYGGTGLGLSISHNLVDMMGGHIDLESAPGAGTRFWFDLQFEKGVAELRKQVLPQSADIRGKRILLCEDIEINRLIVHDFLEPTGVLIEEFGDGKQALDAFEKSPVGYFDLIIMDVQMPVMNGYEAAQAIRALDREDAGRIPIIAMTANAYKEDVDQAMASGMNGHLSKPVNSDQLVETITTFLA